MRYLIAPLNWGVGHAARISPIVKLLLENGHDCIIASDGMALAFLKLNFREQNVEFVNFPSYRIKYKRKSVFLSVLFRIHWVLKAILLEKLAVRRAVKKYRIDTIISDNRLGVFSSKTPSFYMTHQINIKTSIPLTSWLTSRFHQLLMIPYKGILVPDWEDSFLSGDLSRSQSNKVKYIGPLSWHRNISKKCKLSSILIVLSGPEPRRTEWEKELVTVINELSEKVCLVRGIEHDSELSLLRKDVECHNFMDKNELESKMSEAEIIVSRAGYSTIMDLVALKKKAILVPTPGQEEQEYLAEHLKDKLPIVFQNQKDFNLKSAMEALKNMEQVNFPEFNWQSRKEKILNLLQ